MASAGCNFTKLSGPKLDEIPGKRVYRALMGFQSTAGYDRTALPSLHGGDAGSRPKDVFDGTGFIDQLIILGVASEADNAQASQAGQGSGMAKAEFQRDAQTVKLVNVGSFFNATVQAMNEVEMATDVAAPFPLTSMVFSVKVIVGA